MNSMLRFLNLDLTKIEGVLSECLSKLLLRLLVVKRSCLMLGTKLRQVNGSSIDCYTVANSIPFRYCQ